MELVYGCCRCDPMTGLPSAPPAPTRLESPHRRGRAHDHAKGYAGTGRAFARPARPAAAAMSAEGILTVGYVLWTLVTVAIYLAYRVDTRARHDASRRIEEERGKLGDQWRSLR